MRDVAIGPILVPSEPPIPMHPVTRRAANAQNTATRQIVCVVVAGGVSWRIGCGYGVCDQTGSRSFPGSVVSRVRFDPSTAAT